MLTLFLSLHEQALKAIAEGTINAQTNQSWLISVLSFPVMLKETSIMSWAIIAFGLYEGWRLPGMPKIKL